MRHFDAPRKKLVGGAVQVGGVGRRRVAAPSDVGCRDFQSVDLKRKNESVDYSNSPYASFVSPQGLSIKSACASVDQTLGAPREKSYNRRVLKVLQSLDLA